MYLYSSLIRLLSKQLLKDTKAFGFMCVFFSEEFIIGFDPKSVCNLFVLVNSSVKWVSPYIQSNTWGCPINKMPSSIALNVSEIQKVP